MVVILKFQLHNCLIKNNDVIAFTKDGVKMANLLPITIISLLWLGSISIGHMAYSIFLTPEINLPILGLSASAISFAFAFPLIGGLISLLAQNGIINGKFPRLAFDPVYFRRRVYGLAWTQLFYFRPLYTIILAIPLLKKLVFRLYGYKGTTDFVVYPDTWLRDLPLLKIGKGAYLSNRSTIGTNICLSDGHIYVDKIEIGEKALVGHLAMLAPGVKLLDKAEVGVGCAIGIKVKIGASSKVGPGTVINHGATIGNNVDIGTHSFVGLRAHIADGIKVPAGANIPAGAILLKQEDVQKYLSSETKLITSMEEYELTPVNKRSLVLTEAYEKEH